MGRRRSVVRTVTVLVVTMLVLGACDSGGSESASTTTRPKARAQMQVRPVVVTFPPPTSGEAIGAGPGYDVLESAPRAGQAALRYGVGPVAMTERDVRHARATRFPGEGWVVDITLAPSGVRTMNRLAKELFPKTPPQSSIAIVVDGKVQSAPVFAEPTFSGDQVQISAALSREQARDLAASLDG
jgi:preprotein translocase subunit SecD